MLEDFVDAANAVVAFELRESAEAAAFDIVRGGTALGRVESPEERDVTPRSRITSWSMAANVSSISFCNSTSFSFCPRTFLSASSLSILVKPSSSVGFR